MEGEAPLVVSCPLHLPGYQDALIHKERRASFLDQGQALPIQVVGAGRGHVQFGAGGEHNLAILEGVGVQDQRHAEPAVPLEKPLWGPNPLREPAASPQGEQCHRRGTIRARIEVRSDMATLRLEEMRVALSCRHLRSLPVLLALALLLIVVSPAPADAALSLRLDTSPQAPRVGQPTRIEMRTFTPYASTDGSLRLEPQIVPDTFHPLDGALVRKTVVDGVASLPLTGAPFSEIFLLALSLVLGGSVAIWRNRAGSGSLQ